MIQVWTSNQKGNDKLIGFGNGTIYKANPKTDEETEALARDMKKGIFDTTRVWDIRTIHCSEIRLQDGKPYIEIFWNKEGEEQLRVTDEFLRYKIFELIKSSAPQAVYKTEKWSAFKAGRKPLIALLITLILFAWTLFYALEAQNGTEYYIESGRYDSITGIVLGVASLGVAKVIAIFSVLAGISLVSFFIKAAKAPVMNRILLRKS